MRFLSGAVALLSVGLTPATAAGIFNFGNSDVSSTVANHDNKVPGESPIEFCANVDRSNDTIVIERVDLSPNPPIPGKELVVSAVGTVMETIEEGAYVLLTVKYGLIRLISAKPDLCKEIDKVDLKCPIKRGVLKITKSVEIPKEIPPGKYSVIADVFNADGSHITCLTATVSFVRHGGGGGDGGSSFFGNFDL